MRVHLVTMRYSPSLGGFDDRPLAEFVRHREVLAVREHFFTVHDLPHLACLITFQEPPLPRGVEGPPPTPPDAIQAPAPRTSREPRSAGRDRPDPFHDLPEAQRDRCVSLRRWRSDRARKEGVPPYVLLTNRDIIAIVTANPATPNALSAIDGVGPGKVERYGAAILALLHGTPQAATPVPASTAPDAAPAGAGA